MLTAILSWRWRTQMCKLMSQCGVLYCAADSRGKMHWASEVTLSDAASGRRRQGGVSLTVCMGHTRSQAIDGPSSSSASN